MNSEILGGYDSPAALRETPGEWEVNYLLPQMLPGAEYPTYATTAWLSHGLRQLFAALRAPRMPPRWLSRRAVSAQP